jgi:hypothetical protein
VPIIKGSAIVGWQTRPGCRELLSQLRPRFTLILWTVSSRRYVDKALSFGLAEWFHETYSWDEIQARWKDVRQIRADFLVDDSPHHRETAEIHGFREEYIVVPAYGSPEDSANPLGWTEQVLSILAKAE